MENKYKTIKIGNKNYNALQNYAESKGMTVDEVFKNAIHSFLEKNGHIVNDGGN